MIKKQHTEAGRVGCPPHAEPVTMGECLPSSELGVTGCAWQRVTQNDCL